MKKLLYFIVPVVALSIASCQKEVSVEKVPEGVERTVTFVTSNEAVTKTYLEEVAGNRVFRWYNGDRIKIYDGVTNQVVTNVANDGAEGSFTASVESSTVTAVYPYSVADLSAHGTFSGSIPQNQTAVANGVNPDYCPLIARTNNAVGTTPLAFCNVASLIRFRVGEDNITGVTIATNVGGKDNVPLAGDFTATLAGTSLDITGYSGAFVNCNAPGGGFFQMGKDYYISVLPANLAKGFVIILHRDGLSDVNLDATRPLNIERSTVKYIGVLTSSLTSSEFAFADNSDIKDEGVIREWDYATQFAIRVKNPGALAYTADFAMYEDEVKVVEEKGISNEATLSGYSGNVYFEGGSSASNLIWLRNYGVNSTDKVRRYEVTIIPATGTPIVANFYQYGQNSPKLRVSKTSYRIMSPAKDITLDITSTVDWTISGDAGLTFAPSSGSGNATVTVSVAENTSASTIHRQFTVSTAADVLEKSHTVDIEQLGVGQVIEWNDATSHFYINGVTNVTGTYAPDGGDDDVYILDSGFYGESTPVAYFDLGKSADIEDVNCISVPDGCFAIKGPVAFNLGLSANPGSTPRNLDFVFRAETNYGATKDYTLTFVQPANVPTFGVASTAIDVLASSTSATINVTGNVAWTASVTSGTATLSASSGTGASAITVNFAANSDTENTKVYVVRVSTGASVDPTYYDVTITQAKAGGAAPTYTYTITKSAGNASGSEFGVPSGDMGGNYVQITEIKLAGEYVTLTDEVVAAVIAQATDDVEPESSIMDKYPGKTFVKGGIHFIETGKIGEHGFMMAFSSESGRIAKMVWKNDDGTENGYWYIFC